MLTAFPREPWRASLDLTLARSASGATVLAANRHSGPIRVQKALYPEGADLAQVLLVHPPAGIASGDELSINLRVASGARGQVTTPGAGKWYRSFGAPGVMRTHLHVAAGAALEWLPQENLLFDGAHAQAETRVELEGDASYIGWDMLSFGFAPEQDQPLQFAGTLRSNWSLHVDGQLQWLDRAHWDTASLPALAGSPVGLRGRRVVGTMIASNASLRGVGAGGGAQGTASAPAVAPLAALRAITASGDTLAGSTALPWGIVIRALASEPEDLRAYFAQCWQVLRPALLGRAAVSPRIWRT